LIVKNLINSVYVGQCFSIAKIIYPNLDIAVPIYYYGDIVGSKQNAENFGKSVQPPTKVVVL